MKYNFADVFYNILGKLFNIISIFQKIVPYAGKEPNPCIRTYCIEDAKQVLIIAFRKKLAQPFREEKEYLLLKVSFTHF